MGFPARGIGKDEILEQLKGLKQHDLAWEEGKVFAYIYDPGEVGLSLVREAFDMYLVENGLDPTSFPSCMELEKDVMAMVADLLGGDGNARGSFTTGGTESIMLSVKTARDWARAEKPEIVEPELLLPETAHPAFFKACQYLGVKPVVSPVDPDTYAALPDEMRKLVTPNTIMLVGSAPSYAHGVVDPIEAMAAISLDHGLLFHTDACVGGMYLPFARELGYDVPAFDLSVPGVTQISADLHKWGYAAKGASTITYKDGDLRRHQIFAWSGWTGYSVINPTVTSTKSGGPVAGAWAILNYMGREGYKALVAKCQDASIRIRKAIDEMEGVRVLGNPQCNLFSFTAEDFDIFALSEDMRARGWFIQAQFGFSSSPANLHLSVGPNNAEHVDEFLADLEECVRTLREAARGKNETGGLPPELLGMLEQGGDDAFDKLSAALGLEAGAALPDRMDVINNLLNQLPFAVRDGILKEFIHRAYAKN